MTSRALISLSTCMILLILTGCAPEMERQAIEDLDMAGVIGFDQAAGHKYNVTVSVPQPTNEQSDEDKVLSSVVQLPHEMLYRLSARSGKTLSARQVRVILFSEEMARNEGLLTTLLNLYRDPLISNNAYIAVVKGTVHEFMSGGMASKQKSMYLNDLLHPRESTSFSPFTTLRDFIFRVTNEVSDPMVPYLEKHEEIVEISKIGLFREDRLVAFNTLEETRMVEMMRSDKHIPNITVDLDLEGSSQQYLLLDFVRSRMKTTVKGSLDKATIHMKLMEQGAVQDFQDGLDLEDPADINKLERESEKHIKQDVHRLIQKYNRLSIDPAGIGRYIRAEFRGDWTREKWRKSMQDAEYNIDVRVRIRNTGTMR
ncbi:hypothetical protein SY83_08635 [Paenibacillus swuensis]|uniref:Uncharacterized protein n=1 Tax=Paenibacillus swuensis TaxID=1178515 RepID=A0A172TH82_9BACL|nr:Ger(x)C family spore germination protein [Paenibacillus swuensis]ANE46332.1 hypothetical protein SY83_08635 [Paenibacillus swuensis]